MTAFTGGIKRPQTQAQAIPLGPRLAVGWVIQMAIKPGKDAIV